VQRAERLGNALFMLGAVFLPLGAGAAAGYWIADRGVRWVPDTVAGLLLVWLLGLLLMLGGSVLSGPIAGVARNRKRILSLGALAVLVVAVRIGVYFASKPTPLAQRTPIEFAELLQNDAVQVRDLDRTLDGSIRALETILPSEGVLTADREAAAAEAFAGWVDSAFALDQLRLFYEDYYRLDLSRLERDRHVNSFLLTFAAELALFEHAARLIAVVERNPNAAKFLELARPERNLPQDTLTKVKDELRGTSDFSRIVAGKRYLRYLAELHDADDQVLASGLGWMWKDVEDRLVRLGARNAALLAVDSVSSDFAPLERNVKLVTFPVQKGVAEWMGDTRVKRAGRYLIGPDLQAELRKGLRPGDVLLARKNWYLSNVGLPGFWPHAMIYVGSEAELRDAFDSDEGVRAWIREESGEELAFTAHLARRFPRAWRDRTAPSSSHGELVIIEAISEGVSQSDLHHTVGDYVAALRPNLPPVAKAKAIARAFSFLGRPYDFDFDFATDDALVCTELVWRSYRTQGTELGLHLPPSRIAGRLTLPANTFARVFRDERATAAPQFSFVAFIEGREHHQDAVISNEEAFVSTVDRSKWDYGQP
jgi:hypothetical protein